AAKNADPSIPTDIRWEGLRPVLEKGAPLFIRAQELEQMQSAVTWAADRGFKCVIVGGRDAEQCIDLLKKHDVAVMVTGAHRMPRRRDSAYDEPFTLPAILEESGLRWCMATAGGGFSTSAERNLPYHIATCVAYGLDPEVAIRSITLSAAEVLGVADRLGSIEPGKAATLIITDGNPLEIPTNVEVAFIDGRRIDLSNKQTDLNEKYLEKYRQLGVID
ncbi:MAG: amidohydrolase family protein, partial [Planctomycetota bacterium]|nr:amidohydrolase family protein [Planctomycetota bacterium]